MLTTDANDCVVAATITVKAVLRIAVRYSLAMILSGFAIQLKAAVVLQYHHVSDHTPASTSTSIARFERHLQLIETQGFEVVSLPTLLENFKIAGENQKSRDQFEQKKQLAITFDDGYESVYRNAYPRLKSRNWPFTIFVNTQPLDERWAGFFRWSELREMLANGVTVGNHSSAHDHLLQRLQGENSEMWRARVAADVTLAQQRIEAETDQAQRLLAYPFGEFDRPLRELVESLGFVAFGQHSGALTDVHSWQALPRFPFGGHYGDDADFVTKLNARPLPLAQVNLYDQSGKKTDAVVSEQALPTVELILADKVAALQCFGPSEVKVTQTQDRVLVSLAAPVPEGRSRINCTARHFSGGFMWFSQPLFRLPANGRWLD
ncbi:MAG: polysaccharide deacetylase [Cellvibrionaceae bacterium]|nr:polysaccharide deacetylase [Cellvibrionaceae bacterium]|tara:strand:+ start:5580 stop:6713 length:1134 start_codon:yes stop_codon:yes gene_type:complete